MSIKRRLIGALGANAAGQIVTVAIQLLSVPIFMHIWTLENYGKWLILSAIPAYFSLSDLGFLSTAINRMTIASSAGRAEEINVVFQTAIAVCAVALGLALSFAVAAAYFFDAAPLDTADGKISLVLLAACAIIAMSSGLIDAVFRAKGEYAFGTHICNFIRLAEWFGLILGATLGRSFMSAAGGQLIGRSVGSALGLMASRRRHPDLVWGLSFASRAEFRRMLRPALSFMAFPVANALSIQGMTLLVGHLFGAAFLAMFNTYRTISRVLVQVVTLIARSLWPEISRQYGAGNIETVRTLYKKGRSASVLVAIAFSILLIIFGHWLVTTWTLKKIEYNQILFLSFIGSTILTSTWQMGMVVFAATNNHTRFSRYYLISAVIPLIATFALRDEIGIYSSVVALVITEIWLFLICELLIRKFWRGSKNA